MVRTESSFVNRESMSMEGLRLGILALILVEPGQVVEGGGGVGMLGSQLLLIDHQRSLVERLRLGILALILVEPCQAVQAAGRIRMLGSQLLLTDRQRSLVEGLRFGILRTFSQVGPCSSK